MWKFILTTLLYGFLVDPNHSQTMALLARKRTDPPKASPTTGSASKANDGTHNTLQKREDKVATELFLDNATTSLTVLLAAISTASLQSMYYGDYRFAADDPFLSLILISFAYLKCVIFRKSGIANLISAGHKLSRK